MAQPAILTKRRTRILRLLVQYKALTSRQIWQAIDPTRDRTLINHELAWLAAHDLVKADPLEPERGASSQYLWRLLRAGAEAVEAPFGNQYYRQATAEQIRHRGLLLELQCKILRAGWKVVEPYPYNPRHRLPPKTPQSTLIENRLYEWVRRTLDQRDLPNEIYWPLSADFANKRLTSGWPRQANDWVAHYPGRPEATVIFIPQPPDAGKQFWTRSKGPHVSKPGRIKLYQGVTKWFWVCGVFADDPSRSELGETLKRSGLGAILPGEVPNLLAGILSGGHPVTPRPHPHMPSRSV